MRRGNWISLCFGLLLSVVGFAQTTWASEPDFVAGFWVDGPIAIDPSTRMMWQRQPGSPMTFEDAENHCASSYAYGRVDWRLPTVHQLGTLVLGGAFAGDERGPFWSSTAVPAQEGERWTRAFGGSPRALHVENEAAVLCVRALRDDDPVPNEVRERFVENESSFLYAPEVVPPKKVSLRRWGFPGGQEGPRLRFEYILRPTLRGVPRGASTLDGYPDVKVMASETHFLVGLLRDTTDRFGWGIYADLGATIADGVGLALGVRPLVAFPVIAIKNRTGLRVHLGAVAGYRNVYFNRGDLQLELRNRWRIDGFAHLVLQLGGWNILVGGGIDMNGKGFFSVGVEGWRAGRW